MFANGYGYYKEISIDQTKIVTALTNFLLYVDEATDTDLESVANGGKVENGANLDVRFETPFGTKLDHRIIQYTATTGRLMAVVRVPNVSSNSDQVIRMYYGKTSPGDEQNITGLYTDYEAVWVMDNKTTTPDVSGGTNHDATSGNNALLTAEDDEANIPFRYAISNNRSQAAAAPIANPNTLNGDLQSITITGLYRLDASQQNNRIMGLDSNIYLNADLLTFEAAHRETGGTVRVTSPSAGNMVVGEWHHFAWRFDRDGQANPTAEVIFNGGVASGSVDNANLEFDNAAQTLNLFATTANNAMNGALAEVRASLSLLSNDHLSAEYENYLDSANFYTKGTEVVPDTGIVKPIGYGMRHSLRHGMST